MLGNFGITEILLIAFIVLLVFGPKRLPQLARSCGEAVNEFKDAMNSGKKGKKLKG
ncbi:twin-arginine translocase TatA/TatE family subunit [Candidatus Woesearchaeota archaeon]|nr:twin-arginine translocase TatA/TatE family subunit [Candidatus Woesearchaeota archaeon]